MPAPGEPGKRRALWWLRSGCEGARGVAPLRWRRAPEVNPGG